MVPDNADVNTSKVPSETNSSSIMSVTESLATGEPISTTMTANTADSTTTTCQLVSTGVGELTVISMLMIARYEFC